MSGQRKTRVGSRRAERALDNGIASSFVAVLINPQLLRRCAQIGLICDIPFFFSILMTWWAKLSSSFSCETMMTWGHLSSSSISLILNNCSLLKPSVGSSRALIANVHSNHRYCFYDGTTRRADCLTVHRHSLTPTTSKYHRYRFLVSIPYYQLNKHFKSQPFRKEKGSTWTKKERKNIPNSSTS